MSTRFWIAMILASAVFFGLVLVGISGIFMGRVSKARLSLSIRIGDIGMTLLVIGVLGIFIHLACTGGIDWRLLPTFPETKADH